MLSRFGTSAENCQQQSRLKILLLLDLGEEKVNIYFQVFNSDRRVMRVTVDSSRYLYYQHKALKEENWLRKSVQPATTQPFCWAGSQNFLNYPQKRTFSFMWERLNH